MKETLPNHIRAKILARFFCRYKWCGSSRLILNHNVTFMDMAPMAT